MWAADNTAAALTNTTISGHVSQARVLGGAFYITYSASLNLTSCNLSHYESEQGGGIFMSVNSSLTASRCTLSHLSSSDVGGGLYMSSTCPGCSVTWTNSRFLNVSASSSGGMWVGSGVVALHDIIFVNSHAESDGGALLVSHAAKVWMTPRPTLESKQRGAV